MKNNCIRFISMMILVLGPVLMALSQGPGQPTPIPQPDFGSGGAVNCPPSSSTGAPIDGGYWILLVFAIAYGIYQFWYMRKAEKPA
jgi:hypothetical protein